MNQVWSISTISRGVCAIGFRNMISVAAIEIENRFNQGVDGLVGFLSAGSSGNRGRPSAISPDPPDRP